MGKALMAEHIPKTHNTVASISKSWWETSEIQIMNNNRFERSHLLIHYLSRSTSNHKDAKTFERNGETMKETSVNRAKLKNLRSLIFVKKIQRNLKFKLCYVQC